MASVTFRHVSKYYQDAGRKKKNVPLPKPAVDDVSMEIEDKEFVVFVGPSGCGKSTTLRLIAGLEDISEGELYIDGELVNDVLPKDRDIAMVFQNYALYPHMTVYDNMAFGLKMRKVPKAEIDAKIKEAARILDIEEYLNRKPKALSGGQRQRVALGRALVRQPKVFLLDEPLSNLDAKLRTAMRTEITNLHERLQTTFIYVTHDQVEAMTMGTRIVVMKDGRIQQIGSPKALFNNPANKFVAGFIGTPQMNFFDAVLNAEGEIVLPDGAKVVITQEKRSELKKLPHGETEVIFGIRPEDVFIAKEGERRCSEMIAETIEDLGNECLVYGRLLSEDGSPTVAITIKTDGRREIRKGEKLAIVYDSDRIHLFDAQDETTLFGCVNGAM